MSYRKVEKLPFEKKVIVPSSKSYANRIIILAALNPQSVKIDNLPESSDVDYMLQALETIGLEIERNQNSVEIKNSFPSCESDNQRIVVKTGDGGTTNRFLIPFLSLGKNEYILEPTGHMKNRPMDELERQLTDLRVVVNRKDHWFSVKGPMVLNGNIKVDCSKSTQFATGLALSLAYQDIDVIPENLVTSMSYWQMTQELISKKDNNHWKIPIDFSGIGYPLALAATDGKVEVSNFKEVDPFQSDSIIVDILKKMGVFLRKEGDSLIVEKSSLKPIEFDCSNCPDLIPTLAYLCSCAEGKSVLKSVEVLKHKESDRLFEICKILDQFSINHEVSDNDELIIFGKNETVEHKVILNVPEDHRMVMVGYLFLRHHSGGEISNSQHVNKSFKSFFEVME